MSLKFRQNKRSPEMEFFSSFSCCSSLNVSCKVLTFILTDCVKIPAHCYVVSLLYFKLVFTHVGLNINFTKHILRKPNETMHNTTNKTIARKQEVEKK